MAGPGEKREWLISDHPGHRWIRDTWPSQPVDPASRSTARRQAGDREARP